MHVIGQAPSEHWDEKHFADGKKPSLPAPGCESPCGDAGTKSGRPLLHWHVPAFFWRASTIQTIGGNTHILCPAIGWTSTVDG